MQKIKWFITIMLFYGFMFSDVWAHDYWIMPETFQPKQNSILKISFGAGHAYFENEETPDVTKFRLLLISPQGREIPIACSRIDSKAIYAKIPIFGQGTYIISAVSTMPEYWSKTTDGFTPGRKSEFQNVLSGGMYIKSTKTFFTVGTPSSCYQKSLGHIIEIIPQQNPSVLKTGMNLSVLIMFQNKPLENVPVFGIYEGYKPKDHSDQPVKTRTNKNGIATVKIDRSGKWIIYARHELKTPGNPDADFENYRPYMMFEIKK